MRASVRPIQDHMRQSTSHDALLARCPGMDLPDGRRESLELLSLRGWCEAFGVLSLNAQAVQ